MRRLVATLASRRPHVLVLEAAGGAAARRAVEDAADLRGWPLVVAPADADVLVLAGRDAGSGGEHDAAALERVWSQLPGPRARAHVIGPEDAEGALLRSQEELADDAGQRRHGARRRRDEASADLDEDAATHMAPHGVPLAGSSEDDPDGLEMDVLEVPLGPLLPGWPGGLALRATLHGDRVDQVSSVRTTGTDETSVTVTPDLVVCLDAVAATLALAGDPRRAARVRAGRRGDAVTALAVVREVASARRRRAGLLGAALGPAGEPVGRLLDRAAALLRSDRPDPWPALTADDLADLLTGHDLGDVRLLVAALAPRLVRRPVRIEGPS